MTTTYLLIICLIIAGGGVLGILFTALPLNTINKFFKKSGKIVRTEPKLSIVKSNHTLNSKPIVKSSQSPQNTLQNKYQEFVVLYLMAPENQYFKGYQLWEALIDAKLSYGEMQIFHAYDDKYHDKVLFSVAGATEPGYFNVHQIEDMCVSGLCLFMEREIMIEIPYVFEAMMHAAYRLRDTLGGTLYDSDKKLLTDNQISYYQAQISSD